MEKKILIDFIGNDNVNNISNISRKYDKIYLVGDLSIELKTLLERRKIKYTNALDLNSILVKHGKKDQIDIHIRNLPLKYSSAILNNLAKYQNNNLFYYIYPNQLSVNHNNDYQSCFADLSIREILELKNAKLQNFDNFIINPNFVRVFNDVYNIFKTKSPTIWNQFIAKLSFRKDKSDSRILVNKMNDDDNEILEYFISKQYMYFSKDNIIISNDIFANIINSSGRFLETIVFYYLTRTNLYHQVLSSMRFTWKLKNKKFNSRVANEIDVVTLKNNKLTFISCKNRKVNKADLLEIYYLSKTFDVKAMIVVREYDQEHKTFSRQLNCDLYTLEEFESSYA